MCVDTVNLHRPTRSFLGTQPRITQVPPSRARQLLRAASQVAAYCKKRGFKVRVDDVAGDICAPPPPSGEVGLNTRNNKATLNKRGAPHWVDVGGTRGLHSFPFPLNLS